MADPDFTFLDGFDKYGGRNAEGILTIQADALFQEGEWDGGTCSLQAAIGTTKGNSIGWANSIYKYLTTTYARVVGGACFQVNSTSGNGVDFECGIGGSDCTVQVHPNGNVYLRRGTGSATIIGTGSGPMFPLALGSVHFISWDLTLANVSGRGKVWVDGVLVIDYTGDTTSAGSDGINYFQLYSYTTANRCDHFYCDFYLAAGGSETPFLTNPIIDTSDVTTLDSGNFSPGSITLGDVDRFDSQSWNPTAGRTYLRRVKADDSGNITGVAFYCGTTDAVAKYKACIYSDNAGVPNSLLGSGPDTTSLVVGWNTANLTAPVAIVAGTWYWIGFRIDTSNRILYASESISSGLGYYYSATYSAAFLATASGLTSYYSPYCAGIMTGMTNRAATINSPKPDNSLKLNYNFSNTVGQEDLFNHNALPGVPTAVHHVALKAMGLRSDAGPRTADLRLKSGATTSSGSNTGITPNPVDPKWMGSHYRKDPNGNIAWTVANHNNIKIGYKLVS